MWFCACIASPTIYPVLFVLCLFQRHRKRTRPRPLDFAGYRIATVSAWSSILSTSAVNARRWLGVRFVSRSAADFVCRRCSADCGMILVRLLQVLTLPLRLPSRSYSLHHCVSFSATPCMSVHTRWFFLDIAASLRRVQCFVGLTFKRLDAGSILFVARPITRAIYVCLFVASLWFT